MERHEGKKGDRVRLTKDRSEYGLLSGATGSLEEDNDGAPFVKFDGVDTEYAIVDDDLELIPAEAPAVAEWKPKVGDRVRYVGKSTVYNDQRRIGWTGTVKAMSPSGACAEVDYDNGRWGSNFFANLEPITADATEAAPVVAPLRIEAGRYYKTRDGRKVGPIYEHCGFLFGDVIGIECGKAFQPDGKHGNVHIANQPEFDLIAEWVDEQPARPVATASNDNAAPATPKFKVGDRITGNAPAWGIVTGEITAFDNSHPTQTYMIKDDVSGYTMWLDNDTISAAPAEPTAAPTNVTTNLTINVTNLADLDAVIAKLKKIRKLQRQIAA